ncbi:MAG: hypothetical protein II306_07065 [Clostridia bacterium]|nr:hypothetical protein [Clostridia bacterium]
MPREKANYSDMLNYLIKDLGCPLTMSKTEASRLVNLSRVTLDKAIRGNRIKVQDGKIPIGSVASYLLG